MPIGGAGDGVLRERLAVLGSPIAHSKSPVIHAAAYEVLGLDWSYDRERLEAEALEAFLASRGPEWRGFSLTMPLKEEAHRIASVLDPVAAESGVVNTLLRIASGVGAGPRWAGFNTDVPGLAAAIAGAGLDASNTIVIGSGATAVSAILAARRLGAQRVEIVARNTEAIGDLVGRFGGTSEPGSAAALHVSGTPIERLEATMQLREVHRPTLQPAADPEPTLVISTLPGPAGRDLALPERLTRIPLFDVAYDPWPSPLAEGWQAAGGVARPGIDMLVEQAVIQIRIFMHGDPERPLPDEVRVREAMRGAAGLPDMGG
ncbi:shikimate dehydrogenase family protein [Leucobacter celer]|uniref:shikimate dehydrogenase family protein n=1 Tax=Leucobacter celer TaxID=668625 RepID=UPI000AD2C823|nr:shikimate dehydrogenase [Leucobacter celer]